MSRINLTGNLAQTCILFLSLCPLYLSGSVLGGGKGKEKASLRCTEKPLMGVRFPGALALRVEHDVIGDRYRLADLSTTIY